MINIHAKYRSIDIKQYSQENAVCAGHTYVCVEYVTPNFNVKVTAFICQIRKVANPSAVAEEFKRLQYIWD